jgi:hypothetical protein
VSEPSEGKAKGFESPGGLGTEKEARRAGSLEQQVQGAKPQGAIMLEKGLGVKDTGVKETTGARNGGYYLRDFPGGGASPRRWPHFASGPASRGLSQSSRGLGDLT